MKMAILSSKAGDKYGKTPIPDREVNDECILSGRADQRDATA